MLKILKLHNKHKNQPIWITGSDPSLDTYPDNFLDNKIGITLHLAAIKFPKTTYRHFNEYDRFAYCKKNVSNFLEKKNIVAIPFYERSKEESLKLVKDAKQVYYFKLKPYPPDGKRDDVFTKEGRNFMEKKVVEAKNAESIEYGGFGTCLHTCLFMAILMGGNPINLIGNNHESKDGKDHFNEAEKIDIKMRPSAVDFSGPTRAPVMKAGTNAIIKACKKYGIIVNWHKKYEK